MEGSTLGRLLPIGWVTKDLVGKRLSSKRSTVSLGVVPMQVPGVRAVFGRQEERAVVQLLHTN